MQQLASDTQKTKGLVNCLDVEESKGRTFGYRVTEQILMPCSKMGILGGGMADDEHSF